MKTKIFLGGVIAAIVAVSPVTRSLFAQARDITGTWQGTLHTDRDNRIVMKVTKDGGAFRATLYNIDQGARPIPTGAVTLQGTAVKITVPSIGGVYEAKLSNTDGNTMTGTWIQGPNPLPFDMTLVNEQNAWAIPEPPPLPTPMAEDASPSWEAATIKPSNPDAQGIGIRMNGRNFSTVNTTLSDLVTFAYELHPRQIVGAPGWVETEKFDLAAIPDKPGMPSDAQIKGMMKKLLAERFQLRFHTEKKELSVFVLTVARGGPKLTVNDSNPNGLPSLGFGGLGNLQVRNASMGDFTGLMQARVLDRPVVDQSELKGRFDFTLRWTPDETQFGGRGGQAPGGAEGAQHPDLFKAIQEQLGLRLEATKAPTNVLAIDHVEKPSAN